MHILIESSSQVYLQSKCLLIVTTVLTPVVEPCYIKVSPAISRRAGAAWYLTLHAGPGTKGNDCEFKIVYAWVWYKNCSGGRTMERMSKVKTPIIRRLVFIMFTTPAKSDFRAEWRTRTRADALTHTRSDTIPWTIVALRFSLWRGTISARAVIIIKYVCVNFRTTDI